MTLEDAETQEAVEGLTAFEDTKRGYGLWRGEVIHPADPRMDIILASGDPITDTKGLGLRYTPVRGASRVPHFRVNDPERFSAALDRAFSVVHDAVVRVIAEDIRARGYAALRDWCERAGLPDEFEVWQVRVEMCCDGYRPDICVLHPEGGRIELEVVNTHAPEAARLDKAWAAGHIVMSMSVRGLVEDIVFSQGRGMVPDDATLLEMLRRKRFTLWGRSRLSEQIQAVWRDLNLAAFCEDLSHELKVAWQHYNHDLSEVAFMLGGGNRGDTDDSVKPRCDPAYDRMYGGWDRGPLGFIEKWFKPLVAELEFAAKADSTFLAALRKAEAFLDAVGSAAAPSASSNAAKRLRYRIMAMRRIKEWHLSWVWAQVSEIAADEARKLGWNGWIKRNLGSENMPGFMRNLKGEE